MPTTFASSINSNPIYADRAEHDAAGNLISTTYATKAELPEGVPTVTSSDDGKVLQASYSGGTGSVSWVTPSGGGGTFYATCGVTPFADILAAYTAGKAVYCIEPTYTLIYSLTCAQSTIITFGAADVNDGTAIVMNRYIQVTSNDVWLTREVNAVPPLDGIFTQNMYLKSNGDRTMSWADINQVPTVTSSDDGKVLTADYTGGVASYSWVTPSAGGSRIAELTVGTSTWADFTAAYAQLTAGTIDGIKAKLDSQSWGMMTGYYADLVYVTSMFGAPSGATFSAPAFAFSNGVNGKRISAALYVLDSMGTWTTTYANAVASDIVAGAGISVSTDASSNIQVSASDPLPAHPSTESGKVLSVSTTGATEWVFPCQAGTMVSISGGNTVNVSTTAGITDIQRVNALPANPVSTVLYLIPET